MNSIIPGATHYRSSYLGADFSRLSSYREQLRCLQVPPPASVLVIGKGDGLVVSTISDMGYLVDTLDISSELDPTHVGDVRSLPFDDNSYDVVMCCQVLEHIPFVEVSEAVAEISRVARKQTIISVPDQRRYMGLEASLFRFKMNLQFSLPRLLPKTIPEARFSEMGHYWEVGYKGFPAKKVIKTITNGGKKRVFRVHNMPWHLFITQWV